MNQESFPYRVRQALGMTTTEAAQLVHVTRRTWEMWEAGKIVMPRAKSELFVAKLQGFPEEKRALVVVLADDGFTPLDVVASDRFCSLKELGDGKYEISSLAIRRLGHQPYVHRQLFWRQNNEHVFRVVGAWKSVLE